MAIRVVKTGVFFKLSFQVDFFLNFNSSICFLEDQILPYTFNQQTRVASKQQWKTVQSSTDEKKVCDPGPL